MVVIYTQEKDPAMEELRAKLRAKKIPCSIIGAEYGNTSLSEKVPFLICAPGCNRETDAFLQNVPSSKILQGTDDVSLYAEIQAKLYETHKANFEKGFLCGIYFINGRVRYRLEPLSPSPNERLILNLLLFCRGTYFQANELAAFCLEDPSVQSIPVHVCNLNKKCIETAMFPLIKKRRYSGYRIPADA